MKPGVIVEKLQAIGWFENRPQGARDEKLRHLQELAADDWDEFLLYLEISDFAYTNDCVEDDDSYVELLGEYAAASRGVFRPSDIAWREDPTSKRRVLSFSAGGRAFTIPYDGDSKYVDEQFNERVNAVLKAVGAQERFVILPVVDEGISVVFVTPALHRAAIKAGVIPKPERPDPPVSGDFPPEIDPLMLKLEDSDPAGWELLEWEPADWMAGEFLREAKELLRDLLKNRGRIEKQRQLVMAYRERTGCRWGRSS